MNLSCSNIKLHSSAKHILNSASSQAHRSNSVLNSQFFSSAGSSSDEVVGGSSKSPKTAFQHLETLVFGLTGLVIALGLIISQTANRGREVIGRVMEVIIRDQIKEDKLVEAPEFHYSEDMPSVFSPSWLSPFMRFGLKYSFGSLSPDSKTFKDVYSVLLKYFKDGRALSSFRPEIAHSLQRAVAAAAAAA